MPDIQINCPHCRQSLEAPDDMAGETIECPACHQAFQIPKSSPMRIGHDDSSSPPEKQKLGLKRNCPSCGKALDPRGIICVNCGYNVQTGQRLPSAEEAMPDRKSANKKMLKILAVVLCLAAVAGASLFGWRHYNQALERDALIEREALAKREALVERETLALGNALALARDRQDAPAAIKIIQEALVSFPNAANRPEAMQLLVSCQKAVPLVRPRAPYAGKPKSQSQDPAFYFHGNAADFLDFMCIQNKMVVLLNDDSRNVLGKVNLTIQMPTNFASIPDLTAFFGKYGMVSHRFNLTQQSKVEYMAEPATLAYYTAVNYLNKGNLEKAYDVLNKSNLVGWQFGEHSVALRNVLRDILELNLRVANDENKISSTLKNRQSAKRNLELASRTTGSSPLFSGTGQAVTKDSEARVAAEEKLMLQALNQQMDFAIEKGRNITACFIFALDNQFNSEALFLYEQKVNLFNKFRAQHAMLQNGNINYQAIEYFTTAIPQEMQSLFGKLKLNQDNFNESVKYGLACLEANPNQASKWFAYACELDTACPQAVIGKIYCDYLRYIQSISALFGSNAGWNVSQQIQLESELKQGRKAARLRKLHEFMGVPSAPISASPNARIGTAQGLLVYKEGARTCAIIGNEDLLSRKLPMPSIPVKDDAWKDLNELSNKIADDYNNTPVIMSDNRTKDWARLMPAIQARKWLQNCDTNTFNNSKGLNIEIRDQAVALNLIDDSVGVTMAIAGYSAFKGLPIRQDVALTGSLKSDGTVKRIGSVCEKIFGALNSDLIETVIVPRENDADLLALPPDLLCKITIIEAENMEQYLKYALSQNEDVVRQDEIKNMGDWIMEIANATNAVSQYIRERLSPATAKMLAGDAAPTNSGSVEAELLKDINNLLLQESFYETNRFAQVSLSTDTIAILQKRPTSSLLVRRNRLLLEDAYPDNITPCSEAYLRGNPVDLLQEAQLMILTGALEKAKPILEEVESRCPEIYNARRLLDLMGIYAKSKW